MQQFLFEDMSKSPSANYCPADLMSENIPYDAVEALLEDFLQDELSEFELLDVQAVPETSQSVKYKYSSGLQKSIRRGHIDDAVKYALTYHSVDPIAFWNRLVIICLEDGGVGNPMGVALTLAAARSKVLRQRLGGDKLVIHYVVKLLAESTKDRTVADMYQILDNRSLSPETLTVLKSATHQELSDIVLSDQHPCNFRIAAAWMLWGTDKLKNGRLPLRTGDRDLFENTIERLKVPGIVKYICLRGMVACRCAMNLTYAFVWLMMKQSPYTRVIETALPVTFYIKGLPSAAYDQHTRDGKAAYHYFYKTCAPVDNFLTSRGIVGSDEIVAAIGISLFISESALLDKRIDFEGAEKIYQMTVEDDFRKNGLTMEDGRELSKLILDNAEILRRSRIRVVEGKTV